jgi:hypothetical protein
VQAVQQADGIHGLGRKPVMRAHREACLGIRCGVIRRQRYDRQFRRDPDQVGEQVQAVAVAERQVHQRKVIGTGTEAPACRGQTVRAFDQDQAGALHPQALANSPDDFRIFCNQQDTQRLSHRRRETL